MRLTLTHKYVGSLFGALITCCAVVLFVSIHFMKEPIEEELDGNIRRMQNVIHTANDLTATRFAQSAMLMAHEQNLARAVLARDHQQVMLLSEQAMKEAGSDFMTVTDEKGTVVGRGHSKKWQDSVLNQETVVKALQGTPSVAIVAGTVVPFTIRASQPIIYEGKLVGTLSIGTSLVTPPYLDWLKKLSGMDVTIFKGDTRAMTTIMKDGKRAVGTKLQSPEIVEAVLQRGELVFAQNNILGVAYKSAYWPVKAADGTIAGMWFVGMPLNKLMALENKAVTTASWVAVALLAVQLLISVAIGLRVSAPVRKITRYVRDVAGGKKDAVLDVHSRDDMGELAGSLRGMVEKQDQLMRESVEKADEARKKAEEAANAMEEARRAQQQAEQARRDGMISAAGQIEGVVDKLNVAINDIGAQVERSDEALSHAASRLAETATAMEEMNSSVLEVAKNAGLAADVSTSTRQKATDGAAVVSQSVAGIQEVQSQSLALKDDMVQLDEHAKAINQIMSVISDIADQTNLLALNAAIEAARAGEAGRGFAVVADEVRKLAEKTMTSTIEVSNAIKAIQTSTDQSTQQVEQAVRNIAQATEFSNKSGESLQEILQMVEHTADEVRAIATASEEQSAASEEITRSIAEVNSITSSTSEAMREAAKGLESLRRRSQDLIRLIDEMKNA
ncbi:methyl-accepting chemotaxis protein [Desulfovibrio porci]|uniref:methyl-accepting chemotaxis protein n=1 Tax=Desulfovibrio porci TaxID=2605782 RepID=UPI002A80983B|nr:methyl-accepting chemotaxis protein [Desulfovibrio porci]MDY3811060.1 methyl-accepting chemotaxis protein [Desulfovibrio porci]